MERTTFINVGILYTPVLDRLVRRELSSGYRLTKVEIVLQGIVSRYKCLFSFTFFVYAVSFQNMVGHGSPQHRGLYNQHLSVQSLILSTLVYIHTNYLGLYFTSSFLLLHTTSVYYLNVLFSKPFCHILYPGKFERLLVVRACIFMFLFVLKLFLL